MTTKLFKILFLSFIFFVSNSCKKDKPDDSASINSAKLIVSDTEALPYQFIIIQLPDGSQPADANAKTSEVKIGDSTVIAYRTDDNSVFAYGLQLPELASGKYSISAKAASGEAKADITIKAYTAITDVNEYIMDYNTHQNNEFTKLSQEYDAKVQGGTMRKSTADSLKDFVKKAQEKNADLINKLSESEKKKFAYMYEANKHWLLEYKNAMAQYPLIQRGKQDADPCQQYVDQWEFAFNQGWKEQAQTFDQRLRECRAKQEAARLEWTKTTYSGRISAAYDNAKKNVEETGDKLKAGWAFVSAFVADAAQELSETAKDLTTVKDPFAPLDMEDPKKEKKNTFTFLSGEETFLSAGINVTNLNRQNAAISPELEVMISNIDNFKQTLDKIDEFLPYTLEADVPAAKTEKIFVTDYSIDQISNPNISVILIEKPEGKKIKFTANNNVTDPLTAFTFRINVNTEFGNVSKVIDAELMAELKIGSKYKGGVVAYIFMPGDPGYISGEKHGLIAAENDQQKGIWGWMVDKMAPFGTSIQLGTGKTNTAVIIEKCKENTSGTFAAKICDELVLNGYDDWYLPSKDELNKLYLSKDLIGGFASDPFAYYWSSSELEDVSQYVSYEKYCYCQLFSNGQFFTNKNNYEYNVRAIRSF